MKLTSFTFLLLFLLKFSNYKAQLKGSSYQFPDKFSSNYFFDPSALLLNQKEKKVVGLSNERLTDLKIVKSYAFQMSFDNNSHYLEWYDLEKYLKQLLDTLTPLDFDNKNEYKPFIKRVHSPHHTPPKSLNLSIPIWAISESFNEVELIYFLAKEIAYSKYSQEFFISYENENSGEDYRYKLIPVSFSGYKNISNFNEQSEILKFKADSFALACLNKLNLNLNSFDYNSHVKKFKVNYNNKKSYNKKNNLKNYIIDSVYFNKLKKIATEEYIKTDFEIANFKGSLVISFRKYLQGDNSLKNLFYLIESCRRIIYQTPELVNKGFLAEHLQFTQFEGVNFSILKKPKLLFSDSLQFLKAEEHPILKNEIKPFNTYEEAFFYFTEIAQEKKFNEATFSKALYFYFKQDDSNFRTELKKYIDNGGGLYNNFANNLSENGSPLIKTGKTNIIIDNCSNYSENDNYFHSLQRISSNSEIKDVFKSDSVLFEVTMLNELLGTRPKKLYSYQKLKWHINELYNEADETVFYKRRYKIKENMEERAKRNKYNKNILIFAPEFYNWFQENNFNGIAFQKIKFEYSSAIIPEEFHNYFQISYLNFIDNRPFFYKSIRNGNVRKENPSEIAKMLREYLFYKE